MLEEGKGEVVVVLLIPRTNKSKGCQHAREGQCQCGGLMATGSPASVKSTRIRVFNPLRAALRRKNRENRWTMVTLLMFPCFLWRCLEQLHFNLCQLPGHCPGDWEVLGLKCSFDQRILKWLKRQGLEKAVSCCLQPGRHSWRSRGWTDLLGVLRLQFSLGC